MNMQVWKLILCISTNWSLKFKIVLFFLLRSHIIMWYHTVFINKANISIYIYICIYTPKHFTLSLAKQPKSLRSLILNSKMSIRIGIKHKFWCENFVKLNFFMTLKIFKRSRANILMNNSHFHGENFFHVSISTIISFVC